MTNNRRPHGLEIKAAPAVLAPRPAASAPTVGTTTVDTKRATVRMVAAVTGTRDEVGDVLVPGAFARTLRPGGRPVLVVRGHDWNTPIGRVTEIKELRPGHPDLPRTTGAGRPWPRAAGAVVATARLNTAIPAGRDALEMCRFFGADSAWSIGYKTIKSRQVGGIRELQDVELYEISPVLHGAHPDARLLVDEVKSARAVRSGYERKTAPAGVSMPVHTGKRWALTCENCGLPVALADRPLPDGTRMFCSDCVESVGRLVDPFAARDLDVTSEQAFADALDGEQDWWADSRGEMRRGPRG